MSIFLIVAVCIVLFFPAVLALGFFLLYAGKFLDAASGKVIYIGLLPLKLITGDFR